MKRLKICKWVLCGAIGVSSLGVLSCSPASDPFAYPVPRPPLDDKVYDGANYKKALEAAIMNADQIVVEEHSAASDFDGIDGMTTRPRYRYAKRVLTPGQQAALLANVRAMHPATRTLPSNCAFAPHHTLSFSTGGRIQSKMKISYHCGDVKWDASNATEPANLISALTPTIQALGLQTHRDWKRLAQDKYEKDNKPGGDQKDGIPIAKRVPGKPGFVYNPFTGKEVEVAGIPARTKVRDPNDPDETHIFRVP